VKDGLPDTLGPVLCMDSETSLYASRLHADAEGYMIVPDSDKPESEAASLAPSA
jgi:hypothetical protein